MENVSLGEITFFSSLSFKIGLTVVLTLTGIILLFYLQKLIIYLGDKLFSEQIKDIYNQIIKPETGWLTVLWFLSIIDIVLLIISKSPWLKVIEIPLSLTIVWLTSWLSFRWFRRLFDRYLLDLALNDGKKINGEFLIIGKYGANAVILIIVIFIFAQVHNINLFGLLASLGIGGLAVAFAAQKTLEQFLGGIVLYVDRPFVQDDYIGLPDGTFGQVESIGLRSTKIRTSGKGTLMIIPNSSLTQTNIENFTGAKKLISIVYLTFHQQLPQEEKALIRQIIIQSTKDIVGLDSRNTDVTFKDIYQNDQQDITQAQVSFFILGSGNISMDLRRQLLDIANQNITVKLKEYGILFDLEDKTINVDSPITI